MPHVGPRNPTQHPVDGTNDPPFVEHSYSTTNDASEAHPKSLHSPVFDKITMQLRLLLLTSGCAVPHSALSGSQAPYDMTTPAPGGPAVNAKLDVAPTRTPSMNETFCSSSPALTAVWISDDTNDCSPALLIVTRCPLTPRYERNAASAFAFEFETQFPTMTS